MTITKTLKVTTVLTVLTIAIFFMASGFSSLTMGSFLFTDVFAQGGQNIANQGISQANNAANTALCSAGVITGAACNTATNQGNSNSGSNTAGQTASGGTGTTAKSFNAKLSGTNEVPPHETKATGTATFNLVGTDSITYTVHVKDMKMVTAAHIHQGKVGENGPVVVVLYNNSNPSATTNGELAKGTITASNLEGPLAGKQVKDLIDLIESGGAYANVHTTANPMGEIRGQIVAEKTGTGTTGGTNTANQGISQSNTASTASQCAAGTLMGPACSSTTNQGNSNSGSNTAGQVATGS
ncbi:MAG: CHRD domain-containing protein [Candidatus Nitrosocosmicus sp.]